MGEFEEKLNQILSSPQAMEQILSLANSIAGAPAEQSAAPDAAASTPGDDPPPAAGLGDLLAGLDGPTLGRMTELFSVYRRQADEKTQLLTALQPFLLPERRSRLEQAVRIVRLSRVIRAALGMVQGAQNNV